MVEAERLERRFWSRAGPLSLIPECGAGPSSPSQRKSRKQTTSHETQEEPPSAATFASTHSFSSTERAATARACSLTSQARSWATTATTAAMDTFTASKGDKHPTDLAKLRGARIVTASETEHGHAWAESRIKALTGGDRISARFMRQDFFEYDPQFKLTIIGNHKPVLRNVDDAMRRRVNIVPFLLKPEVVDPDLEAKLIHEAPAILQWMVEGCLDWQVNGLIRPDVVKAANAEYFSEQDTFTQWIEECCEVEVGHHPFIWDYSGDLYASWKDYCLKAGEEPGSNKAFADQLGGKGIERHRASGGARAFKYIRLKPKAHTDYPDDR